MFNPVAGKHTLQVTRQQFTFAAGGLFLANVVLALTQNSQPFFTLGTQWDGWIILAILAVGPSLVGFGLYTMSLRYLQASTAGLIASLEPALTAILLCAKRLSPGLSATWLVGAHCGLGAVLALPYLLATTTIVVATNELLHLALASFCAGFVPTAFFYWALARVPAQHAAVLTYLEPVVSATLAALVLGEGMGAQGLLGSASVLAAGVAVVWRRGG